MLKKTLLALSLALAFAAGGCGAEPELSEDSDGLIGNTRRSFEDFKAALPQESWSGAYIVEGDIPIYSDEALEAYYATQPQPGALIVNQVGGIDDRWPDDQKDNLTYCVSKAFAGNHDDVVNALAVAASDWQKAAPVKFVYASEEDAACDASNTRVVFDVQPVSGQSYLARAFFPSYPRSQRTLLVDSGAFGSIYPFTLAGIMRHELGHVLGFRHEHIRPEHNPTPSCSESEDWRALTPYDSSSVMHYPNCAGSNRGDLVLTSKDKYGALLLYATWYNLVARHSNRCMDVYGKSTADEANIQQFHCAGTDNQRFAFLDAGGGYFQIVARHSGKCVDVYGKSTADEANLQQFHCTGASNQSFRLVRAN